MQNACGRVKSCVCSADAYVIYITWPGTPHFCVGAIRRHRRRCPLLIPGSGLVPFVVDKMFLGQTFRRLRFTSPPPHCHRLRLKCDGTRAETKFRLSAKRTSPFKSAGASVQSTTGRRAVQISLQGLYCSCKPVFCSHMTLTGYPLHSLVSPSLLLPCVTVCHHISTGLYHQRSELIPVGAPM